MDYVLLDENGYVINLLYLLPSTAEEMENVIKIPDDYFITIGDQYIDGNFYRDGEKILSNYETISIAMDILLGAEDDDNV